MSLTLTSITKHDGIFLTYPDGRPAGEIHYKISAKQRWVAQPAWGFSHGFADLSAAEYYILAMAIEREAQQPGELLDRTA
jgi:hypothetical protein